MQDPSLIHRGPNLHFSDLNFHWTIALLFAIQPIFQCFLRLRLQYIFHLSLLQFKIAMLFIFILFEQSEIMATIICIVLFAVSLRIVRYTKVLTIAKKENQKSINWYQSSSKSVKLETKILWIVELRKMFCIDHAPVK